MVETCPDCDLLQEVPVAAGKLICCARCGGHLRGARRTDPGRDAAIALASLILLVIANSYPILSFELNGLNQQATVFDGVRAMWTQHRFELAVVIAALAIVVPIAHAGSVLIRSYLLSRGRRDGVVRSWALWVARLAPWGMTEVYLLGALVAFVKLDELATVVIGPALYAFAIMSLLTAWSASHAQTVWAELRR